MRCATGLFVPGCVRCPCGVHALLCSSLLYNQSLFVLSALLTAYTLLPRCPRPPRCTPDGRSQSGSPFPSPSPRRPLPPLLRRPSPAPPAHAAPLSSPSSPSPPLLIPPALPRTPPSPRPPPPRQPPLPQPPPHPPLSRPRSPLLCPPATPSAKQSPTKTAPSRFYLASGSVPKSPSVAGISGPGIPREIRCEW